MKNFPLSQEFEIPANQSDHEKNQKNQDVICKWVSGQDVLNLLADWSQKKREKKNTFTEKWVNNKNSTHENRNMLKPM